MRLRNLTFPTKVLLAGAIAVAVTVALVAVLWGPIRQSLSPTITAEPDSPTKQYPAVVVEYTTSSDAEVVEYSVNGRSWQSAPVGENPQYVKCELDDWKNEIRFRAKGKLLYSPAMSVTVYYEPLTEVELKPLPRNTGTRVFALEGAVTPGAQVVVNGHEGTTKDDGTFTVDVPVDAGVNDLVVVVSKERMTETSMTVSVFAGDEPLGALPEVEAYVEKVSKMCDLIEWRLDEIEVWENTRSSLYGSIGFGGGGIGAALVLGETGNKINEMKSELERELGSLAQGLEAVDEPSGFSDVHPKLVESARSLNQDWVSGADVANSLRDLQAYLSWIEERAVFARPIS